MLIPLLDATKDELQAGFAEALSKNEKNWYHAGIDKLGLI